MKNYTLHRIGLWSLFKIGFLIGLLNSLLPNILLAWAVLGAVRAVAGWMAGLTYQVPLFTSNLPGIELDGVEFLRLQGLRAALNGLAATGFVRAVLAVLGMSLLAGVLVGLAALVSGAVFNLLASLSGGLQVTLSEAALQPVPQAPPALAVPPVAAAPVPAAPAAPPQSGPWLEVVEPLKKSVQLILPVTLIGSDPACQVQLVGLQPRHAQVTYEDGRYLLRDLSGGQSQIQGHPVQGVHMLKDGFVIRLAHYTLVFHLA